MGDVFNSERIGTENASGNDHEGHLPKRFDGAVLDSKSKVYYRKFDFNDKIQFAQLGIRKCSWKSNRQYRTFGMKSIPARNGKSSSTTTKKRIEKLDKQIGTIIRHQQKGYTVTVENIFYKIGSFATLTLIYSNCIYILNPYHIC